MSPSFLLHLDDNYSAENQKQPQLETNCIGLREQSPALRLWERLELEQCSGFTAKVPDIMRYAKRFT